VPAFLLTSAGCTRDAGSDGIAAPAPAAALAPREVTALGRLQPKDGIVRLSGPSRPSGVIAKLLVDTGQWVDAGQPIAILDTQSENEARVAHARVELASAQTELGRLLDLFRQGLTAASARDAAQLKVDVAKADLDAARSALDRDTVRAPMHAQIVAVHARSGERVGVDGIAEIAETDRMYAVAEVYETDVGRVRVGKRATIASPALPAPLGGTVERIGTLVGKRDVLDVDPVARIDARVVEVEVRLDDSAQAGAFSNLQVTVAIESE
jgi:HlyD family secretion protein